MPITGSTHDRGYGTAHQRLRVTMLRTMHEGTLCVRCGQPMFRWQELDLGHGAIPAMLGGRAERLEHASCNRRAGALMRNAKARRRALPEW